LKHGDVNPEFEVMIDSSSVRLRTEPAVQTEFKLPTQQWKEFLAALDKPATPNSALRRLLTEPSVLEQG
jgi:uncharacterized protein (DUF1778 family)